MEDRVQCSAGAGVRLWKTEYSAEKGSGLGYGRQSTVLSRGRSQAVEDRVQC